MDRELLHTIFDHSPDAIYVIDPESSNILYCNEHGWRDLQLQPEEVVNHSVLTLQMNVGGLPAWKEIAATIRESDIFTFVGRHQRKDGSVFSVEVNTSSVSFDGKEYFLSIARDITKRQLHDQDILDREAKLWFALNEALDGLWDWNIVDGSVFFSPQLKRMLGYGPDEMSPQVSTWEDNIHPEDKQRVMQSINDHLMDKRERYEAEYRLRNRNGHYIWVHDRGKICERSKAGQPIRMVGMAHNITEQKRMEQRLQEMAALDELTGIMNRREGQLIFEKQLDLAKRLNLDFGLCLFDLDHFKQINDLFGHLIGDQVLKYVCDIVGNHIRKSDYFYRWGGEEFILLLPDTSIEQLEILAEKIRMAIEGFDWKNNFNIETVTASMGLATFPNHGTSVEELMVKADTAMYVAKANGRNQFASAKNE